MIVAQHTSQEGKQQLLVTSLLPLRMKHVLLKVNNNLGTSVKILSLTVFTWGNYICSQQRPNYFLRWLSQMPPPPARREVTRTESCFLTPSLPRRKARNASQIRPSTSTELETGLQLTSTQWSPCEKGHGVLTAPAHVKAVTPAQALLCLAVPHSSCVHQKHPIEVGSTAGNAAGRSRSYLPAHTRAQNMEELINTVMLADGHETK